MKKVYIVTSYDIHFDMDIEKVFSKKEDAEKFVKLYEHQYDDEGCKLSIEAKKIF